MIRTIAVAELRAVRRDGRLTVMALGIALIGALAIVLGVMRHGALERAMQSAQRQTERQFLEQGAKSPHSAAHYGVYAFRPEPPLGFFDRGLDDWVGVAVFLEPHRPRGFEPRSAETQTSLARFGAWSLASVLQLLVPLLIVVLGAGAIAGERERGTLRLLRAEGVSASRLALGKALGLAAIVALVTLPGLGLAAVGLRLGEATGTPSAARVGVLVAAYVLYLLVFLAVALGTSARASTTRVAMAAGLAFWVLAAIVGPRVVSAGARHLRPVPDVLAWNEAGHSWSHDASAWQSNEARVVERALREHGVTTREQLPFDVNGLVLQQQEDLEAPKFDAQYGALHGAYRARERALAWGSALAPLLAVQTVSMAAAGTDTVHAIDFWQQAERHRRTMVRILNAAVTRRPAPKAGGASLGDRADWAEVPSFRYDEPSTGVVLAQSTGPLVVLSLWLVLGVVFCARSLRRVEGLA